MFLQAFCRPLSNVITNSTSLLEALFVGTQVYFNYTGNHKCLSMFDNKPKPVYHDAWNIQVIPRPLNFEKPKNIAVVTIAIAIGIRSVGK